MIGKHLLPISTQLENLTMKTKEVTTDSGVPY